MKFFIHSRYGETLDLALYLQQQGHEVLFYVPEKEQSCIGDGLVSKAKNWFDYHKQGYIWIFDGCSDGKLQDHLRMEGEFVFGGSDRADRMENDRQLNQAWFKAAGFQQPKSENFTDFDSALEYVKTSEKRLILKQNGEAPKGLSHMGQFDDGSDMVYHLEKLKKSWNEAEFGHIDFDLCEIVEGLEVAASAWFNGNDFLRNESGSIVGFLNFEEKKEANGGTGETCGEMGTTFIGCTSGNNKLFHKILDRPKIIQGLQKMNFRGVFDINCIKGDHGITALEPTMRLGIPSTSYEMEEGLGNCAELIEAVAKGDQIVPSVTPGFGMVMVVVAKPFPLEAELPLEHTSLGEKLWLLDNNRPLKDSSLDNHKEVHLYNFRKEGSDLLVATSNGYLLTVTGSGDSISHLRSRLIKYIKQSLYLSGMKYRTDIGVRVEQAFSKKGK